MCADVGSRFNRGFEPLAGCPSALARQRREDRHVFLYAFDLLELNGKDLRREPLEHRKRELARLLAQPEARIAIARAHSRGPPISYSGKLARWDLRASC